MNDLQHQEIFVTNYKYFVQLSTNKNKVIGHRTQNQTYLSESFIRKFVKQK